MRPDRFLRRGVGFLRFCGVFTAALAGSTWSVALAVLRGREALHPNLVTLDTRGLGAFEVLLLTHCITLTPGTTSVQVAEDLSWILVHALDGRDPEAVRQEIGSTLQRAILGFTR